MRAAAMSISARCGSSHAVRYSVAYLGRASSEALHRAVGSLERLAGLPRPQRRAPSAPRTSSELTWRNSPRQRLALEQVGDLRLDALVAARRSRRWSRSARWRAAASCACRCAAIRSRSAAQRSGQRRASTPLVVGVQHAAGGAGLRRRPGAGRAARPGRRRPRSAASMMRSAIRVDSASASGESNGSRSWKKTSCRPITPEPDRPPARVGRAPPARSGRS